MKRMQLMGALTLGLFSVTASAEPSYARMYKSTYGYMPSCNACHKDGGGTPVNDYGESFKQAKMQLSSFATIADVDSDGDGFPNGQEAAAKASPGSPGSTPSDPGDWLDISNLIPKEVQAVFPGITKYKPMDAILTEKEFTAARGIGVELTKKDENTIYLPLNENNRPAGIAVIQPAVFNDKEFYLVVATDGRLNIKDVVPINTKHVPQAEDSPIYAKLQGNPAKNLKAPAAINTVDDAIVMAVKKATTVIRLRLGGRK